MRSGSVAEVADRERERHFDRLHNNLAKSQYFSGAYEAVS